MPSNIVVEKFSMRKSFSAVLRSRGGPRHFNPWCRKQYQNDLFLHYSISHRKGIGSGAASFSGLKARGWPEDDLRTRLTWMSGEWWRVGTGRLPPCSSRSTRTGPGTWSCTATGSGSGPRRDTAPSQRSKKFRLNQLSACSFSTRSVFCQY
jgi:hypothetical protein